jgi:hypothetical protein
MLPNLPISFTHCFLLINLQASKISSKRKHKSELHQVVICVSRPKSAAFSSESEFSGRGVAEV